MLALSPLAKSRLDRSESPVMNHRPFRFFFLIFNRARRSILLSYSASLSGTAVWCHRTSPAHTCQFLAETRLHLSTSCFPAVASGEEPRLLQPGRPRSLAPARCGEAANSRPCLQHAPPASHVSIRAVDSRDKAFGLTPSRSGVHPQSARTRLRVACQREPMSGSDYCHNNIRRVCCMRREWCERAVPKFPRVATAAGFVLKRFAAYNDAAASVVRSGAFLTSVQRLTRVHGCFPGVHRWPAGLSASSSASRMQLPSCTRACSCSSTVVRIQQAW